MVKKTGLGKNPLEWIADTRKKEEVSKSKSFKPLKSKTLNSKLLVQLREDQVESLEKLVREIMAKRDGIHKKERITKNTIIRAYIDSLIEIDIAKENIDTEETLLQRLKGRIQK